MRCASKRRSCGAAIIVAILTVALVAGIASMLLIQFNTAINGLSGQHDRAQARLLARGAIDWARNILADDARRTNIDHYGESWAIRVPPTAVEEGEVSGELDDRSGLFDVNNLVAGGTSDPVQIAAYTRLLGFLGIPSADIDMLVASLIDWLDPDEVPYASEGAERAWYQAHALGRLPPNAPLVDIDELQQVRGYNQDLVNRLRPFLCALPFRAPLNINTASAEVLAAAIPSISIADARVIAAKRDAIPFRDLAQFKLQLPPGAQIDGIPLAVTSRYFMASGRARFGEAVTRMQVLLDRQTAWPEIVWQKVL
jgi:general secretion pathway protein K